MNSVGTWRSIEDELPEAKMNVLICGATVLQICEVLNRDGEISFVDSVPDGIHVFIDKKYVTHWAYIELPDGEGSY